MSSVQLLNREISLSSPSYLKIIDKTPPVLSQLKFARHFQAFSLLKKDLAKLLFWTSSSLPPSKKLIFQKKKFSSSLST
jgi:hypothetical protein